MATQLGYSSESVGLVILEGTIDPNVGRHALTERVAYGTVDPNQTNDGELATIRPGGLSQAGNANTEWHPSRSAISLCSSLLLLVAQATFRRSRSYCELYLALEERSLQSNCWAEGWSGAKAITGGPR
nr:hypothetical protein [Natrinema soli]